MSAAIRPSIVIDAQGLICSKNVPGSALPRVLDHLLKPMEPK